MRYVWTMIPLLLLSSLLGCATVPAADEDSHRQAASDLLVAVGAERNAMTGAAAMADAMVQGNPAFSDYREVFIDWAELVMTWDNMKAPMIDLYVRTYTEAEIRELIEFYDTPIGQKSLEVMPELTRRGAQIGADLGAAHQAELREMIEKRSAELGRTSLGH